MERESLDTRELFQLDEAIKSTMETIRRSPQAAGRIMIETWRAELRSRVDAAARETWTEGKP